MCSAAEAEQVLPLPAAAVVCQWQSDPVRKWLGLPLPPLIRVRREASDGSGAAVAVSVRANRRHRSSEPG